MSLPFQDDHWLPGFNFNVEEWDDKGLHYETLAICRTLALARAAFEVAVEEKPAGRFMIRSRTRVVNGTRRAIGKARIVAAPSAERQSKNVSFNPA